MFSGIIDAIGEVRAIRIVAGGARLALRAPGYWTDLARGASVAVDGVCLTLADTSGDDAEFDVIAETLRRSTLDGLKPGDGVNLQKSMAVGQRIDGHFVQGHVDAVGVVRRVERTEAEALWWISVDEAARPFIVPKGSITVDGISLTIAAIRDDGFCVAIIPTTLETTTIGRKKAGDRVNIETDILARTAVHYLQSVGGAPAGGTPITMEPLKRHGLP